MVGTNGRRKVLSKEAPEAIEIVTYESVRWFYIDGDVHCLPTTSPCHGTMVAFAHPKEGKLTGRQKR